MFDNEPGVSGPGGRSVTRKDVFPIHRLTADGQQIMSLLRFPIDPCSFEVAPLTKDGHRLVIPPNGRDIIGLLADSPLFLPFHQYAFATQILTS